MHPTWLARSQMSNLHGCLGAWIGHLAHLGLRRQGKSILQTEGDDRLRRNREIAVAGKRCSQGACTASCQAADEQAHAAGGESSDQHAHACAATNEGSAAFAFPFFGAGQVAGIDAVGCTIDFQPGQGQGQD